MRARFDATGDGTEACQSRSDAADALLQQLWGQQPELGGAAGAGICLLAVGGFGRQQLFPFSDLDLLFCAEKTAILDRAKDPIRRITQALWDCGLKVAPNIRALGDLERLKASDLEGSLALLDLRFVAGSPSTFELVHTKLLLKRSEREAGALAQAVAQLTRARHARFGHTLFHLEPNVKDSPGGLRDANVCRWLAGLEAVPASAAEDPPFREAVEFLTATRVFLHLRHGRDDNTLDWHAQHEAATRAIGSGWHGGGIPAPLPPVPDPAYWMRAYFRHARAVERSLLRSLERSGVQPKPARALLRVKVPPHSGLFAKDGVLDLKLPNPDLDPAGDPEMVLGAFALMAETGICLAPAAEERIAAAIPALSAALEDGPRLWARLRAVLIAPHAAPALREMHALGVLELLLPEFHGIDALVIRDAYHRYTVDEHTFVLIDVLHRLALHPPVDAPPWQLRFRSMFVELPHPDLLFLSALLHDTGKARNATDHATASAELAAKVCSRLELGTFETGTVVRLIECHLEMSAALRRDIFDGESVRVFAGKVGTHELLRMLTLFTFADISAVHPDALTPWKAENLWRLSMATGNQLDRSVDEERVHVESGQSRQAIDRVLRTLGKSVSDPLALGQFLEGFPERYLRTRAPETVRRHMLAASAAASDRVLLSREGSVGEVTIVAQDRPQLFTELAEALAAWGLEVVTAEAFSNRSGAVVDTFRFTDPYRTLELNPEERERFRTDLQAVVLDHSPARTFAARRRSQRELPRRIVETRIDFDHSASSHSTLLQLITQDVPGLLRTAALVLSGFGCSVEVALIDTEGEMAIDVFYITRVGNKLVESEAQELRTRLEIAIAANAA